MTTSPNVVPSTASAQTTPRDRLRTASLVLAVIGTVISTYVTYSKLSGVKTVCVPGIGNCEIVQNSIYAYLPLKTGIPVAYLGLAGYIAILAVLLLEPRVAFFAQRGKLLIAGMTLFGFLFSAYLTTIEAFVLHEWCQWCVLSAITMTLLFGIALVRLWGAINTLPDEEED